ncbi:MAG: hypothetical protein NVS2B16_19480 [Chloroflexota bacterium]
MCSLLQPEPQRRAIKLTPENVAHHRSEYARLSRRYARLAWATSANDQRERADMQQSLMALYLAFHPNSTYSQLDDFDVVTRGNKRS